MAQLPAIQINPNNALVDFSPINNAIDQNRQDAFRNNALQMQNRELGMRQQQHDYQMQRDRKNDAHMQVERAGKMAFAIQQMPDSDPAKAAAWQRYLKSYGDGDHTPEELDFRTGPKLAAAAAGQFLDPMDQQAKQLRLQAAQSELSMAPLERQYKQAQINKMMREPAGGEAPSNVKEWEYFRKLHPDDQQRYLTMKRQERYLDLGTAYGKPNPVDPEAAPRMIQKDVSGQASLEAQGKAQGEAMAALPNTLATADIALKTIKDIRNHPGKQWGVGAVGALPGIPGTAQRGFVNLVNQAKGQVFLQAYESLRGGGQISNIEGQKAEAAMARLDRAQSQKDFDAALDDIETIINAGVRNARTKAGAAAQAPGAQGSGVGGWSIKRLD